IFDLNAGLTRQAVAAGASPAFVVWPENKFAAADDAVMIGQVGALAQDLNAYVVVNVDERLPPEQYHNTVLLIGPDGQEVGRRAKIYFVGGAHHGFVVGPRSYPAFDTPYGKVGIGVCYDYHFLDVARGLARSGARILLMPTDDDFDGNAWFPAYHASDGVFRAVENRVAFASGTTSGLSLVVDPYGRIVAEGSVNERGVIAGEVFTVPGQTLYTRWGDWFGWLMVVLLVGAVGWVILGKLMARSGGHHPVPPER
ncbi:MAG: nitrilase, partial [Anaerolinea sp.]|nr:nitrilase [Anaerolinea sp.]